MRFSFLRVAAVGVLCTSASACGSATSGPVPSAAEPVARLASSVAEAPSGGAPALGGAAPPIHLFRPRGAGAAIANAGIPLLYHGGSIQRTPKIYVTFWNWTSDPQKIAPYLSSFLSGIGGSPWLQTVTQYAETARGAIADPPGQLKGTWFDTNAAPAVPSQTDLGNEAVRSAAHFGYDPDAAYVVATATNKSAAGFGTLFCAWHSSAPSAFGTVAYVNLPYMTDVGTSCGAGFVNAGANGLLDGVGIVAGHEIAETQTDPVPYDGWVDAQLAEIGDKCAWTNLANASLSTGTFAVQPLWSNAASACVLATASKLGASWKTQPGAAFEVDAKNGAVWAITTTPATDPADGFVVAKWNGAAWVRAGTNGVHVASAPDGSAYVTAGSGRVRHGTAGGAWSNVGAWTATSLAVGGDGTLYALGRIATGGNAPLAKWNGSAWTIVPGATGVAVAVAADGSLDLLGANGTIVRTVGTTRTTLPGLATALATGDDGSLWVATTAATTGGRTIARFNGVGYDAIAGSGGVELSVAPNGLPWITTATHAIEQRL